MCSAQGPHPTVLGMCQSCPDPKHEGSDQLIWRRVGPVLSEQTHLGFLDLLAALDTNVRPARSVVRPPGADRLHREGCGMVVNPDADPSFVIGNVIDAVRRGAAQLGINDVVDTDGFRRSGF